MAVSLASSPHHHDGLEIEVEKGWRAVANKVGYTLIPVVPLQKVIVCAPVKAWGLHCIGRGMIAIGRDAVATLPALSV